MVNNSKSIYFDSLYYYYYIRFFTKNKFLSYKLLANNLRWVKKAFCNLSAIFYSTKILRNNFLQDQGHRKKLNNTFGKLIDVKLKNNGNVGTLKSCR